MNYKVQGAIKRNKKSFIVCAILWLLLVIVFVAPFSYSVFQANVNGKFSLDIFINQIATNITNPFATIFFAICLIIYAALLSTFVASFPEKAPPP